MELAAINWFAVIAATLVGFIIGFIWYGPLFGETWMRLVGMTEEDVESGNKGKIFGFSLIFQFIMAFCLAMFFGGEVGTQDGTIYGFLTGFGWVAMAIGVNGLFEQRSWKYIFIHSGFWIVTFTLMGLILGAWK